MGRNRQGERSQDEPISNDRLCVEKDNEYKERKVGYDNVITLAKIRPTDIPSNKDIITPGPAKIETELDIQKTILERMKVVDKYIKDNCDKKGNAEGGEVLTKEEIAGKEEILKGIKEKGWMLYTSDKSGKLVLDTTENYIRCMSEHFSSDQNVTHRQIR